MSGKKELVAVVVPLASHGRITPDEEISLRHLQKHLQRYPRYFLAPESLDVSGLLARYAGFQVRRFDTGYFGSTEAHKRLILSRDLYGSFTDYRFILMYHVDALVFSDELEEWCALDFDYIGAPWLKSMEDPEEGFSEVGNGGFALQKVASHLRVMDSRRYSIPPDEYWRANFAGKPWHVRLMGLPRWILKHFLRFNGVRREMAQYRKASDRFWSWRAPHFDPDFRIAPVETGVKFAFECAPRLCYEKNGRRLPFGCHAWPYYDREFWEPFLLDEDPEGVDRQGGSNGSETVTTRS